MPKKSLSEQGIIHLFSQQRQIHHLLNVTHIMEHQAFQILRFNLIDILLILLAKNQLLDPGTFSRQDLLLIPALGPSFGIAPSGTWTCTFQFSNNSSLILN